MFSEVVGPTDVNFPSNSYERVPRKLLPETKYLPETFLKNILVKTILASFSLRAFSRAVKLVHGH